ncbi:hypothetical protein PGB90_007417 [Kerria lacca]
MENSFLLVILFGLICCVLSGNNKLKERFSWKQVDFKFENESTREAALRSGDYVAENNVPLGVEVWKNKLFVTVPRWKAGVAATLTYIDLDENESGSPKLKPYPNWEAHNLRNNGNGAGKIANVFRLNVDVCDRLWLVDQGVADLLGGQIVIHNPKIQVYDLNKDQLIKEYTLPTHFIKNDSLLSNIIADVKNKNCDEAFAYIADCGANALIVYDLEKDESWRITHHFFHFDPLSGDYFVGTPSRGINFQWPDGIFGLALSGIQSNGYRILYFHPLSSTREFAVSTEIIQNKSIASQAYHKYKVLGSRGPDTQSLSSSLDEKNGVLFYTLLNKNGVGCWNSNNEEYSVDTNALIASDEVTMLYPNDLKVDKNGRLWVLADKLSNFLYSQLNFTDINFRIFTAEVDQVVTGTVCDKNSSS